MDRPLDELQFSWKSLRVRQFFLQCSFRKFFTQVPCLMHASDRPRLWKIKFVGFRFAHYSFCKGRLINRFFIA